VVTRHPEHVQTEGQNRKHEREPDDVAVRRGRRQATPCKCRPTQAKVKSFESQCRIWPEEFRPARGFRALPAVNSPGTPILLARHLPHDAITRTVQECCARQSVCRESRVDSSGCESCPVTGRSDR
jgi:hypothetical protein